MSGETRLPHLLRGTHDPAQASIAASRLAWDWSRLQQGPWLAAGERMTLASGARGRHRERRVVQRRVRPLVANPDRALRRSAARSGFTRDHAWARDPNCLLGMPSLAGAVLSLTRSDDNAVAPCPAPAAAECSGVSPAVPGTPNPDVSGCGGPVLTGSQILLGVGLVGAVALAGWTLGTLLRRRSEHEQARPLDLSHPLPASAMPAASMVAVPAPATCWPPPPRPPAGSVRLPFGSPRLATAGPLLRPLSAAAPRPGRLVFRVGGRRPARHRRPDRHMVATSAQIAPVAAVAATPAPRPVVVAPPRRSAQCWVRRRCGAMRRSHRRAGTTSRAPAGGADGDGGGTTDDGASLVSPSSSCASTPHDRHQDPPDPHQARHVDRDAGAAGPADRLAPTARRVRALIETLALQGSHDRPTRATIDRLIPPCCELLATAGWTAALASAGNTGPIPSFPGNSQLDSHRIPTSPRSGTVCAAREAP
jgi:hypothetical protein